MKLDIETIEVDHTLQSRESTDSDAIGEYADALVAGRDLPPVTVYQDGDRFLLVNGFHRVPAHLEAGRTTIEAEVIQGTRDEAAWHAAGANTTHGVRRTNADKRRQVAMALALRPDQSDRMIADHCGVSDKTVASARKELEPGAEIPHLTKRVGKDGKKYAAKPSAPPAESDDDFAWLNEPEEHDEVSEEAEEQDAHAAEITQRCQPYQRALLDLTRIKKDIRAIADDERTGGYLRLSITRLTTDLDGLRGALRGMEPVAPCGTCGGVGCEDCEGTGYWTRRVVESKKQ
ncbi:MAG: ParB/RepB/Spo0J family partition protein [Planctomycetota bacterium]